MAISPPQFQDIKNTIIADITNNLVIINPQTGQSIRPNFSKGSVLLTFADVVALVLDAFYSGVVDADAALRLVSATGSDLDDLVALLGITRIAGMAATVPVLFWRDTADGSEIDIPVGIRVIAKDQYGNATIEYLTVQDWTLPLGLAGKVLPGANGGFATAQCTVVGLIGNIGPNQVSQLGDIVAGVSSVSNPQIQDPPAPTVTQGGTPGSTHRQFALVAKGLSGTTNVGGTGSTTTGAASPNSTNYDILTLPSVQWAQSLDILLNVSTGSTPLWQLIANVPPTQATFNYTGQATSIYAVPSANTSNGGVGGVDDEDDDALKKRTPTVLQQAATSSAPALIAAVSNISGVLRVFGSDDATPGKYNLYYTGVSIPLPTNVQSQIATQIANTKAAGIQVTATQVTPTKVDVAYSFVPTAGTNGNSLVAAINAAITAYFTSLSLGAAAYNSQVLGAILQSSSSILKATVTSMTSGGTTYNSPSDVPATAGVVYGIGNITATVASS